MNKIRRSDQTVSGRGGLLRIISQMEGEFSLSPTKRTFELSKYFGYYFGARIGQFSPRRSHKVIKSLGHKPIKSLTQEFPFRFASFCELGIFRIISIGFQRCVLVEWFL